MGHLLVTLFLLIPVISGVASMFVINIVGTSHAAFPPLTANASPLSSDDKILFTDKSFSSDDKILFGKRIGSTEIYVINADGSNKTRLTNLVNPSSSDPSWSPDDSKIVFSSRSTIAQSDIYVMDSDGTQLENITNNAAFNESPTWSPDGSRIAFVSDSDGNREIYVIYANGTGLTNITNNPSSDIYPAWSPDGTKIAFFSDRGDDDGRYGLYVMDSNGSNLASIVSEFVSVDRRGPAWSPDGTKIAFAYNWSPDCYHCIITANVDGSGLTLLTEFKDDGSISSVGWSPGDKILFVKWDHGERRNKLYMVDPGDGNITLLETQETLTLHTGRQTKPGSFLRCHLKGHMIYTS
jgi:tol-pal system beta propeller repeat protein TolB